MSKKARDRAEVRFLSLSDMGGQVQAVIGSGMANDFPRHIHDSFCFGMVTEGTRIISHGDKKTLIPEQGLFIINPGMSHACGSPDQQGHSYRILCLAKDLLRSIACQMSGKDCRTPCFPMPLIRDKRLASRMKRFFSLLEQPDSLLERETLLVALLSDLIIRHSEDPPLISPAGSVEPVDQACEYIGDHFEETLTLEHLAQVACLSPFHFQRVFLKLKGITPHDYQVQVRIKRACEMLLHGSNLAETAYAAGFADQSHFTRTFKRVVGVSPGRFTQFLPGVDQSS
jgi:AraC-like DNA-binding protein